MTYDDQITFGSLGTALSATGAMISLNEIQTWISIIVTIVGFVLGVLIPGILKIVKTVKDAKKDGKIDEEEVKEISSQIKDVVELTTDKTKEVINDINKAQSDLDKSKNN